jgi:hypothetical protein
MRAVLYRARVRYHPARYDAPRFCAATHTPPLQNPATPKPGHQPTEPASVIRGPHELTVGERLEVADART